MGDVNMKARLLQIILHHFCNLNSSKKSFSSTLKMFNLNFVNGCNTSLNLILWARLLHKNSLIKIRRGPQTILKLLLRFFFIRPHFCYLIINYDTLIKLTLLCYYTCRLNSPYERAHLYFQRLNSLFTHKLLYELASFLCLFYSFFG